MKKCYAALFKKPWPNDKMGTYIWAEDMQEARKKLEEKFPGVAVESFERYDGPL